MGTGRFGSTAPPRARANGVTPVAKPYEDDYYNDGDDYTDDDQVLDDADVDVGVAVETRNYMALVQGRQHPPPDHHSSASQLERRSMPSVLPRAYRDQYAMQSESLGVNPSHVRNNRSSSDVRHSTPGIVEGLPLETGNYAALLAASRHKLPRVAEEANGVDAISPAIVASAVAAVPVPTPAVIGQEAEGESHEDDTTVLGLPISTGNYAAMYVETADRKVRHRGYSDLARDSAQLVNRGRGHAHSEARQRASSNSNSNSTPTSNSRSKSGARGRRSSDFVKRESCFERRRANSSAVILRESGMLYFQSPKRKAWKQYYAVLSGFEFRYAKERAQAPVAFAQVQAVNPWSGKPHGLVFVATTGTQYHAYADSDAERDKWIQCMNEALSKCQNVSGQSKTAYTLSGNEQHEGFMYLRERNREWVRYFFSMRSDGYLTCRTNMHGSSDSRFSGYVQSISFADVHPNGLAMQLDSGVSLLVHTETYDDQMMWLAVIAATASVNNSHTPPVSAAKTSYVDTARPNHAGWLFKQHGLFKNWKHVYVSVHGLEIGYAKDTNAPLDEVELIQSVKEWDGQQHGLLIAVASGQVWRVRAESYESAKQWRNVLADRIRYADRFDTRRYLQRCKRKHSAPVFGGWLTTTMRDSGIRLRQFYVMDGNMLGVADDVDNTLRPIGSIVDLQAVRTVANGMLFVLGDGSELQVTGDSIDSAKAWYDCVNASL